MSTITALVITYNEEANLSRCLDRLLWASQVLVLDSGSTDLTLEIAKRYKNVKVVHREFDSFAKQCNFGLSLIETEWVLSLDCDYVLGHGFEHEAQALIADEDVNGWKAGFRYCTYGKALTATLYPPRCVLYRRDKAAYVDEGHGHRVQIGGQVGRMKTRIDHDDRKPLARWFASQAKYAQSEALLLTSSKKTTLNRMDRLRSLGFIAPIAVVPYCIFVKGLWRDGIWGWHYTLQRWVAECMIALAIVERRIEARIAIFSRI